MNTPDLSNPLQQIVNECIADMGEDDFAEVDEQELAGEIQDLCKRITNQAIDPNVGWEAFSEIMYGMVCQAFRLKKIQEKRQRENGRE